MEDPRPHCRSAKGASRAPANRCIAHVAVVSGPAPTVFVTRVDAAVRVGCRRAILAGTGKGGGGISRVAVGIVTTCAHRPTHGICPVTARPGTRPASMGSRASASPGPVTRTGLRAFRRSRGGSGAALPPVAGLVSRTTTTPPRSSFPVTANLRAPVRTTASGGSVGNPSLRSVASTGLEEQPTVATSTLTPIATQLVARATRLGVLGVVAIGGESVLRVGKHEGGRSRTGSGQAAAPLGSWAPRARRGAYTTQGC